MVFSLSSTTKQVGPAEASLCISLSADAPQDRQPVDFVIAVDVSGSMGLEATLQLDEGVESHGLTLLDIVKHAMRTCVHTLSPGDRCALVSFSTEAFVVLPLTQMDVAGKEAAEQQISALRADGQTNLWGGDLCICSSLPVPLHPTPSLPLTHYLPSGTRHRESLSTLTVYCDTGLTLRTVIQL